MKGIRSANHQTNKLSPRQSRQRAAQNVKYSMPLPSSATVKNNQAPISPRGVASPNKQSKHEAMVISEADLKNTDKVFLKQL